MVGGSARSVTDYVSGSVIRWKLLERLAERSRTPTELALIEKKHVSHVSRALSDLKARGLVEAMESNSRQKYYRATYEGLALYYSLSRAK